MVRGELAYPKQRNAAPHTDSAATAARTSATAASPGADTNPSPKSHSCTDPFAYPLPIT